jgi:hypothetical protein
MENNNPIMKDVKTKANSLTQFIEENTNLISTIEKKHKFLAPLTLSKEIYNLIIFNGQVKNTDEDFSTPSKNRDKIIAISNSSKDLLLSLNKISKIKTNELNSYLKFFSIRNVPFIHSLEDKLKFLHDHFLSGAIRKKYGNYLGNLVFTSLAELLTCLAAAKLQIKIDLNNIALKKSNTGILCIDAIKNDLRELRKRCKKITPKSINEGRHFDAVTRNSIIKLMHIYEQGTGNQPTIYPTGIATAQYVTPFYDFIKDIHPLIQSTLPRNKTLDQIAALACKTLPYYIELKNRHSVN